MRKISLEEFRKLEDATESNPFELDGKHYFSVYFSDWTCDWKYENAYCVFKEVETGKHFMICLSKSGSPFSHYEWEDPETPEECVLIEKVIQEWMIK